MFEQLNFRVNYNSADYSNLVFPERDKALLRGLGRQVAEIAARPIMDERRKLWTRHNNLERTRPVFLCDPENGWNEIIPGSAIQCVNSIARHWEDYLRKLVFWGEQMNDDYVVEPVFNLPYVYKDSQWSIAGSDRVVTEKKTAEQGKAYHIETVLEDFSQIKDITKPDLRIDYAASDAALGIAHEVFDAALEVRRNTVWFWSFGLTDDLVFLRGLERLMFDFIDAPERIHEVMSIIYQGTMERLDFLELKGLLCLNNDGTFVGSGGMGFSDALPAADYAGKARTKDMWGLAESQVTIGISPDMFAEFIFPYQKKIMERFGLTCYGCCEPMDERFDIVKAAHNLRRVSVSPWANRELMADKLGRDYVYSMKPSPSYLALPVIDEDFIRKDLKAALLTTKDNCLELVMKDNHTLGNNPENIKRWARIAREEIEAL
ncbi:MAG: hypothetical protein ABSF43_16780 [Rectinemataceae bacterium]|jgi:hypothetical protein